MKSIIWKIAAYTVFGILSFTAVIMGLIIGLIDGDAEMLIIGVVGCISLIVCVKGIFRLNKEYKDKLADKLYQTGEFITEWVCPEKEWKLFIAEQRAVSKKDAKSTSLWAGGILGMISFFIFRNEMSTISALFVAALCFGGLAGFVYLVMHISAKVKYSKFAETTSGKIAFGKDAFRINDFLIDWSTSFVSLEAAAIDTNFKCPVILLTIKQHAGTRTQTYAHAIPIPSDRMDEALKIVQYYSQTI
jgi:hypothetical protein